MEAFRQPPFLSGALKGGQSSVPQWSIKDDGGDKIPMKGCVFLGSFCFPKNSRFPAEYKHFSTIWKLSAFRLFFVWVTFCLGPFFFFRLEFQTELRFRNAERGHHVNLDPITLSGCELRCENVEKGFIFESGGDSTIM